MGILPGGDSPLRGHHCLSGQRLTTLECWQKRVCRSLVECGFRVLRHAWLSYPVCLRTYPTGALTRSMKSGEPSTA